MLDIKKIREDAEDLLEHSAHDSQTSRIAHALMLIIDHPGLVVPDGWSLVKRPELLKKGVPQR